VVFVCAGNDGRGAIAQIERIAAGYKWKKVQEHVRVVGVPTEKELGELEELGQTLAAGIDFGIF
jgi:flavorubredoxin